MTANSIAGSRTLPGAPTVRPGLAAAPKPRDASIDYWRAAALARVVLYHATGFAWLTVIFPAMGLMFALAGSLTARSVDRGPASVLLPRVRRLLPAYWLLGAVALVTTLWHGWGDLLDEPVERLSLIWWMVPLHTPPAGGASYAWAFTGVLWYLVAYLWFVGLTPLLLRVFRAWPWPTLVAALALPLLLHFDVVTVGGYLESPVRDLCTYAACWILGLAHNDGLLAEVSGGAYGVAVLSLAGAGALVLMIQTSQVGSSDLNHLPLANAWWSAAFVAAVFRHQTGPDSRTRPRRLSSIVSLLNARALTIYLWHFPCLLLARVLCAGVGGPSWTGFAPVIAVHLVLVAAVVLAVGWIEDVSARRPARILPVLTRTTSDPKLDGPMWTTDPESSPDWRSRLVVGAAVGCVAMVAVASTREAATAQPTQSDDRQPSHVVERPVGELPFTAVRNGLGPVERDQSVGGADVDDGTTIAVADQLFERGLGVHAPSTVRLYPDRSCSRFVAMVGLDWYGRDRGSVRFLVLADGATRYDSGLVTRRRDAREVDLAIDGVAYLDLVVEDGGDGTVGDAANWADARLWCDG